MKIPYSDKVNRKARLRTYPVVVRNGMVMAWRHPDEIEPQWEIPEIPEMSDPAWSDSYRSSYLINTVPQEMAENGVDPAHFRYVHGTDDVAEMESYDTDGPISTMLSKQSYVTPRGVTNGRIDVYTYGPGFSKVWFSGIVDAINVATTVPVDDEHDTGSLQLHRAQVRRREADLDGRGRVRGRDQQADPRGHADLGAQGVPARSRRWPTATARS